LARISSVIASSSSYASSVIESPSVCWPSLASAC
jgi:hypothetical protein